MSMPGLDFSAAQATPFFLNQASSLLPAVLGRRLAIARAVVGEERVRRVCINLNLDARSFGFSSAARICSTVSTGMPASCPPYRPSTGAFRSGAQYRPDASACILARLSPTRRPYQATPALSVGLCAAYSHTMRPPQQNPVMPSFAVVGPCRDFSAHVDRRVEVAHDLRVGHLGDDRPDLVELPSSTRRPGGDTAPGAIGAVAELGEPAAHVLDVLVHAEDFLHHQDQRTLVAAGRQGTIGGNRSSRGGELAHGRIDPGRVGDDHRLGLHRLYRQRETRHEACRGPAAISARRVTSASSQRWSKVSIRPAPRLNASGGWFTQVAAGPARQKGGAGLVAARGFRGN